MRILIVDDEYVSRTKLGVFLSAYGICDIAEDGRQALDAIKKAYNDGDPYSLVTMDIDMPGMNGHEVIRKIRTWEDLTVPESERGNLKIVAITLLQSNTDMISCFREGCEGYLRKPITPQNLQETLEKMEILKLVEVAEATSD